MRKVIEAVPPVSVDLGSNLGQIWSVVSLLGFMGERLDPAGWTVISGEAWRFFDVGATVSMDTPHRGTEDGILRGLHALGYECEHRSRLDADAVFDLVMDTIDGGRPLLGRSTEGLDMWGIIAGYDTEARRVLCHNACSVGDHLDEAEPEMMADSGANLGEVIVVGASRGMPSTRDLVLDSLADGAARFQISTGGVKSQGPSAYEALIAYLESPDMEPEWLGYNIETWGKLKPLSAEYLDGIAAQFEEPASIHLEAAGDQFDIIGRNWDALRWLCGWGQEHKLESRFVRRDAANMLKDALRAENRAMAEVQALLGSFESEIIARGAQACEDDDDWYAYFLQGQRLVALDRPDEAAEHHALARMRRGPTP